MPERESYDFGVVVGHVNDASLWSIIWERRADGPDAVARARGSDAVNAIDAALLALHEIRARLVGELRAADDATDARADALLARTHDPATCRNGDHYGQCSGATPA